MSKDGVKPEAGKLGQNDQVNCEAAEPYTEKTSLSGPRPYFGAGPGPCCLDLSREVLQASGLWANYTVELVARPGVIEVKLIGAPKPSVLNIPRPTTNPGIIDELMLVTKERENRLKAAREGIPYDPYEELGEEGEEPLSDEQRSQEEL